MKKKILPMLMLLMMILACGIFTVMAAGSSTQDGISVSIYTDKENYQKDEAIEIGVVVTNMNSFDISNINVKKILPEGIRLADGNTLEEEIAILHAGEQKEWKTTAFADESFAGENEEESLETPSESESEEETSESSSEPESEESSSESPSKTEDINSSKEDSSDQQSNSQPVRTDNTQKSSEEISDSNAEIIAQVINITPIMEEEPALADVRQAEIAEENDNKIQSDNSKTTDIVEETVESAAANDDSAIHTYESAEETHVVISDEENALAGAVEKTEDHNPVNSKIVIFIVIIVLVVCIFFIGRKKLGKKSLSVLLCISLVSPVIAQLTVNAQELDKRRTISVEKVIWIDSKEVKLQTEISYSLPEGNNSGSNGSSDKEKIIYADGVIVDELKQQDDYELMEGSDGRYTVIIEDNEATRLIQEGSSFVLPKNDRNLTGVALVAVEVQQNDKKLEIICEKPSSIGSIIKSIDFEGTSTSVDYNNLKILTDGITVVSTPVEAVAYRMGRKGNIYEENIELPDAKFKLDLLADVKTPEGTSLKGEIAFSIPEIYAKIVADFDVLNSNIYEMEVSITEEFDAEFAVEASGEMSIKLFSVPIAVGGCGLIKAKMVVSLEVDMKGEASLSVHLEQEKGIRYSDGKLKTFCNEEPPSFDVEAKISGFCGPKIALNLVLLDFIDCFGVDFRMGAAMNYTEESHYIWGFGNLVCGELQAYLAAIFELNDDTEIVELLKEKCDSDFSFEIWNADTSPFTYKLHFENGKRVEHCKFSGVVKGYIHNAYDNTPIEGVELKLYGGYKKYTATTKTDENGYFCFEGVLEGENYYIKNLCDTYVFFDEAQQQKRGIDVTAGNTEYLNYKMVPAQNIGWLSVYDIYNGATGEEIEFGDLDDNAKYVVRKGWYNVDGVILYEGKLARPLGYAFDAALPAGKYTITASAKGYMDYIENINILEGKDIDSDCFLIPMDNIQDDTIVMEYVQYGQKQDPYKTRIVCMNSDDKNENFVIGDEIRNESGEKIAENFNFRSMSTAILYRPEKGNIYSFCVALPRWSYITTHYIEHLKNWGDNIKIYKGGKIIDFMNIPYDTRKLYHIFDYDASTDEIIIRNEIYDWDNGSIWNTLYPDISQVSLCEDIANEEESFVDELEMEEETEEGTEMEEVTEEESSMEETDEKTVEETSEAESTFEEDTEEANKEELDTAEEISEEEIEESPESKSSEAENQNP